MVQTPGASQCTWTLRHLGPVAELGQRRMATGNGHCRRILQVLQLLWWSWPRFCDRFLIRFRIIYLRSCDRFKLTLVTFFPLLSAGGSCSVCGPGVEVVSEPAGYSDPLVSLDQCICSY